MSLWQNLSKPIIGLAPMDGITDEPMRQITARYGRPGVIFTEFVNVEYAAARPEKIFSRFWYSPNQRPIVAQLSGVDPNLFYQLAFIAAYLGFDGVDINMGCPAKSITSRGGGARLINDPSLAKKLVLSVKRGLDDWEEGKKITDVVSAKLAVETRIIQKKNYQLGGQKEPRIRPTISVKTRPGINRPLVKDWLAFLLELPIEALIVHGRLLSAGHSGPVDWQSLGSAAQIAHQRKKILIGNGGVACLGEGKTLSQKYHLDGVLIGRAALGNPWVFTDKIPDEKDRFLAMMAHARYFVDLFGEENFLALRKHLAWYAASFPGARKLRSRLVRTNSLSEVEKIVAGN
ncbi:MAG: tRNA-dihydrouridine synthase [Candidatus Shapirobacteria bacterium]|nr:tRNA-dihydrouridine synthase [Candidatus Shapirobacteria bacterium]MDD5073834.1 tRNA-dihydrouridine synthase [Candidatus Shapirobacteria bacterium]